jgi:CheY-like chemotaxis protein/HPt (histidine-containing phosphotransfer) domain-containing protein
MGGTIGVASEVGRGTTFWLELPAVEPPQTRPPAPTAPPLPDAVTRPRRPARTVLYIEDNPSNVRLAEAILTQRPEVTLLVATQGGLGLDLAREHQPAVILLDLNLPDISGEEVLRRIRSEPRTAKIEVVVLSADATADQRDRMRRAGADHYLTKPFEIDEFLARVDGTAVPPPAADPSSVATEGDDETTGPLRRERFAKLRRLYPDDSTLREFVELFVTDISLRIEVLEAAAIAGDAAAVWQSAHAMRGSCSVAGAHRVDAELAQLEALARRDEVPGADEIAALRAAFGDTEQALRGELG